MKNWKIEYSAQSEAEMRDIYRYILNVLNEPIAAQRKIRQIYGTISKLKNSPFRAIVDEEPLKTQNIRRINIGKYSVLFYLDEENRTIYIMHIYYAKREIVNIFTESDTQP